MKKPPNKNYSYSAPTREVALRSLGRYYTEKETYAIWENACKESGVDSSSNDLEDLGKVYKYLSGQSDDSSVVGRSMLIKLRTYKRLS